MNGGKYIQLRKGGKYIHVIDSNRGFDVSNNYCRSGIWVFMKTNVMHTNGDPNLHGIGEDLFEPPLF